MRSVKEKKGTYTQLQSHLGAAQGSETPRGMNDPKKRTHGSQGPWKQNQQEEAIPVCIWCLVLSDLWSPSIRPLPTQEWPDGWIFSNGSRKLHYHTSTSLLRRRKLGVPVHPAFLKLHNASGKWFFSAEDCQEYQTLEMDKPSYWLINNKNWK